MKILCVYTPNSVFKFPELYDKFHHTLEENNILWVYAREPHTGEEWAHAVFKEWSHYIIEGEHE